MPRITSQGRLSNPYKKGSASHKKVQSVKREYVQGMRKTIQTNKRAKRNASPKLRRSLKRVR